MGVPPTPIHKLVLAEPKCPHCKRAIKGLNVAGMKLPVPGPDGRTIEKYMVFTMPCCPFPDCGVILAVQLIQEEEPPAPDPSAGLWTPPGRA
jgi:hypothetical protein